MKAVRVFLHREDDPRGGLFDCRGSIHSESPTYERAAMKFLRRYLDEKEPMLKNFAKVRAGTWGASSDL